MAMDMELCITGPETGKIDPILPCYVISDPGMAMDMELCITGPETGKFDHTLYCHVMLFVPRLFEEKWRDIVFGFP